MSVSGRKNVYVLSPHDGLSDTVVHVVTKSVTYVRGPTLTAARRSLAPTHQNVSGATGARPRTLMPPLSRWILLRHQNEESCHLRGRREAWRSGELECAAAGHFRTYIRVGRCAVVAARIGSFVARMRRSHARTGSSHHQEFARAGRGARLVKMITSLGKRRVRRTNGQSAACQ